METAQQMNRLAKFLREELHEGLLQGESPVDAAIRVLRRQRRSVETLTTAINLACPGALT
jgi:hypothetical protein